jgi:hypothetical protein
MVQAELTVTMPVLVLLLVTGLGAVSFGAAQLRCADAAAVAARLAARDEPESVVVAAARATAPGGAQVQVRRTGERVVVTVSAPVRLPGLGATLPALVVQQSFTVPAEPLDAE